LRIAVNLSRFHGIPSAESFVARTPRPLCNEFTIFCNEFATNLQRNARVTTEPAPLPLPIPSTSACRFRPSLHPSVYTLAVHKERTASPAGCSLLCIETRPRQIPCEPGPSPRT
jgi:hypothetical protein